MKLSYTSLITGAFVLCMYSTNPILANYKKEPKSSTEKLDLEVYDEEGLEYSFRSTFKIYDHKDHLIFSKALKADEIPSSELLMFINKSDLLMEDNNTIYFRVKEVEQDKVRFTIPY